MTTASRIEEACRRIARLDARVKQAPGQLSLEVGGKGKQCGDGWISPSKECQKGAGGGSEQPAKSNRFMELAKAAQERKALEAAERQQQQAQAKSQAGAGPKLDLPDLAEGKTAPLVDGFPPQKGLGGGAYGDTYLYNRKDGSQIVVKVDRLQNLDPLEAGFGKGREDQRLDMVNRERAAMARANELGLGPKPIGEVQKLPDGRLAFAYEFVDGVKLWENHREARMTPEAFELMEKPGMRAKIAAEVGRIARTMADSGFEHGDTHGGNVILGRDGRVTLIDWGYSTQTKVDSPVAKAKIELRAVAILGEMLGVTGAIDMRAGRGGVKDSIDFAGPIGQFGRLASKANEAGEQVVRDYERAWDKDPANTLEDPGLALRRANKLKKELGISYREAEGMVGLEAPLTPEIKARAAAARDAVFGDRQLKLTRRMLDTHFKAWNDYAPAGAK